MKWGDFFKRAGAMVLAIVLLSAAANTHNAARAETAQATLAWNTFLGGDGYDTVADMVTGADGSVYVTGKSSASWGSAVRAYTGGEDAFVAKLDAHGAPVWQTFLGGDGADSGNALAVDDAGNVYVAGSSGADWGSPIRAYVGADAFAAKLDPNGGLVWQTFLGSADSDYGAGIAIDGSGNVDMSGASESSWGTPIHAHDTDGAWDAFAAQLDADGKLVWNTFLGGSGNEAAGRITTDADGNVYVVGSSENGWFGTVYPETHGSDQNAFVVKLNAQGALTWDTFLGGAGLDSGSDVVVNSAGEAFVTGSSHSSWGKPTRAHARDGESDAFVAKLDANGALRWNTFLGGDGPDPGTGITLTRAKQLYITGTSRNAWNKPDRPHARDGADDGFAAQLDPYGRLLWNAFLGGARADEASSIATDGDGAIFAAGTSVKTWDSPLQGKSKREDGYVAQFPAPLLPDCSRKPDKPRLLQPNDGQAINKGKARLKWREVECPGEYEVVVLNTAKGIEIFRATTIRPRVKTNALPPGKYVWYVQARNDFGTTKSERFTFVK